MRSIHSVRTGQRARLNQNRVFPGNPDGTLSYRTAHVVFSEVVSKCDALLDNHGGDITARA